MTDDDNDETPARPKTRTCECGHHLIVRTENEYEFIASPEERDVFEAGRWWAKCRARSRGGSDFPRDVSLRRKSDAFPGVRTQTVARRILVPHATFTSHRNGNPLDLRRENIIEVANSSQAAKRCGAGVRKKNARVAWEEVERRSADGAEQRRAMKAKRREERKREWKRNEKARMAQLKKAKEPARG